MKRKEESEEEREPKKKRLRQKKEEQKVMMMERGGKRRKRGRQLSTRLSTREIVFSHFRNVYRRIMAMNINKEFAAKYEEDKTNSSTNNQLCFSANFMHHTQRNEERNFKVMMMKSSRRCIKCIF